MTAHPQATPIPASRALRPSKPTNSKYKALMDQIRNAAVEWIAITNTSLIGGLDDARRQVTLHAAAKIRGMFNQFRERLRGSRKTGPSCTVRVSGRFDGTPDGGPDWDFRCRDRGDCDQQFHDVRELGRAGGRNRILLVVRGDRKRWAT